MNDPLPKPAFVYDDDGKSIRPINPLSPRVNMPALPARS
jgi:hypothetical protein